MHADVDQCYNAFIDKISLLFEQACPIKNIEVKSPDLAKPYITAEIKNQIKEKHKLQRLYNKYPLTYGQQFCKVRNKLNNTIRAVKSNYYKRKLSADVGSRESLEIINSILGRNNCKSMPDPFFINSDPVEIADGFNNYFSTIGDNLASDFIPTYDFINNMPVNVISGFFFIS